MAGHPRFKELLEEIKDLHERKNTNYATEEDPLSNLRKSESFGIPGYMGCLVRMSDKWSRIQELTKGKEDLVGESLKDTLQDLASYSLLCIILLEEYERKTPSKSGKTSKKSV